MFLTSSLLLELRINLVDIEIPCIWFAFPTTMLYGDNLGFMTVGVCCRRLTTYPRMSIQMHGKSSTIE